MDKTSNNIKLGVFIILISSIFTYGLFRVSGGSGLINSNIKVQAEFDNVKGLLTGNMVRYSGVKIGTVSDIEVKSGNVLTVTMSIDKDVQNYLKSDAEAEIGTDGLVGNVLVNIHPGPSIGPPIKDGDLIKTKKSIEVTDMMGTLSTTNDKIALITESLLQITEKLNKGNGSFSLLINDESLAKNLKKTTRNLSTTSSNLKLTSDNINSLINGAENGEGNLGYLFKDNSLKNQMTQISSNIDSLINVRLDPILHNLEASSLTISNTTKELESVIHSIDNEDGLLGTVMNDTTITNDLKTTIDNLNKGTQKFDESMEALQHHWLLRGFFKKKEKEKKKLEKEAKNKK